MTVAEGGERGLSSRLLRPLLFWAPPLVAFLLYLPTLGFPFLWDDRSFVVENESLRSLANIPRFFYDESTASAGEQSPGVYRPLRNLMWALVYVSAGPSSWAFHLLNLVLHTLNTALVGWLCRVLLPARWEGELSAALAAALFAVHPLGSEAVSWVKAGDDLLVASPCLLAAVLAARAGHAPSPTTQSGRLSARHSLPISLLFAFLGLQLLAVLAKETGVVLPGLVLVAYWAGARSRGASFRTGHSGGLRWLSLYVLLAGALDLVYVWARSHVLGEVAQVSELPAEGLELLFTQLRATAQGLGLLLWPVTLQADYYGFAVSRGLGWSEIAAVVAVACPVGVAAVACWRRRAPRFVFAVGWWLLALIPVSNLVPTMQFLAERFLYLALAGPAVAAGGAAVWLLGSRRWPMRRVALLGVVVLAALALRNSRRQQVWSDPVALFESSVRGDPGNPRAVDNWARALFDAGRYRESLQVLEKLQAVAPGHLTVADLAPDASRLAAIEADLPEIMRRADQRPGDLVLQQQVAELALRARRTAAAAVLLGRVLSADSTRWQALAGLAVVAALEGDDELASSRLRQAAALRRSADDRSADGRSAYERSAEEWEGWRVWVDRARAAARLRDDPGRGARPPGRSGRGLEGR